MDDDKPLLKLVRLLNQAIKHGWPTLRNSNETLVIRSQIPLPSMWFGFQELPRLLQKENPDMIMKLQVFFWGKWHICKHWWLTWKTLISALPPKSYQQNINGNRCMWVSIIYFPPDLNFGRFDFILSWPRVFNRQPSNQMEALLKSIYSNDIP